MILRYNRIVFLLIIIISNSYSNNLENFYKLLEQQSVLRLSISIMQEQFEKKYKSFGDFFILGSNKYFYDSSELKISVNRNNTCLLYTSPSPRDYAASRMPSSA